MNRGSEYWLSPKGRMVAGFNEAPIHESGKFPKPQHCRGRYRRFNEAPIHESGKWTYPK